MTVNRGRLVPFVRRVMVVLLIGAKQWFFDASGGADKQEVVVYEIFATRGTFRSVEQAWRRPGSRQS
jgi:hypothetical protein